MSIPVVGHVRADPDVRVVHAWLPTPYAAGGWWTVAPWPTEVYGEIEQARELARDALEDRIRALQAEEDASTVTVACVVREGFAVEVLLDEARTADLLVVGSRGHGGFKGLLLGSVSATLAHHTPCPLGIVRSARAAAADTDAEGSALHRALAG